MKTQNRFWKMLKKFFFHFFIRSINIQFFIFHFCVYTLPPGKSGFSSGRTFSSVHFEISLGPPAAAGGYFDISPQRGLGAPAKNGGRALPVACLTREHYTSSLMFKFVAESFYDGRRPTSCIHLTKSPVFENQLHRP